MIKEVSIFSYRDGVPMQQAERWYLQEYANTRRKLPHLVKYLTYTSLVVAGSEYFRAPVFYRLEESFWQDERHLSIARESEVGQVLESAYMKEKLREYWADVKSIILVNETNILQPELSGSALSLKSEPIGHPYIKVIWPFKYTREQKEGDHWFYDHHSYLTGRSFNLVRYVAYQVAEPDQQRYGFQRMSELYWRDLDTMLNDMGSPNGSAVMRDNSFPDGSPRENTDNSFIRFPHVVGYPIVLR
jgi:hypothetical protein